MLLAWRCRRCREHWALRCAPSHLHACLPASPPAPADFGTRRLLPAPRLDSCPSASPSSVLQPPLRDSAPQRKRRLGSDSDGQSGGEEREQRQQQPAAKRPAAAAGSGGDYRRSAAPAIPPPKSVDDIRKVRQGGSRKCGWGWVCAARSHHAVPTQAARLGFNAPAAPPPRPALLQEKRRDRFAPLTTAAASRPATPASGASPPANHVSLRRHLGLDAPASAAACRHVPHCTVPQAAVLHPASPSPLLQPPSGGRRHAPIVFQPEAAAAAAAAAKPVSPPAAAPAVAAAKPVAPAAAAAPKPAAPAPKPAAAKPPPAAAKPAAARPAAARPAAAKPAAAATKPAPAEEEALDDLGDDVSAAALCSLHLCTRLPAGALVPACCLLRHGRLPPCSRVWVTGTVVLHF